MLGVYIFRDWVRWYSRTFFDSKCTNELSKKIISAVKSITSKEIFRLHPEVKRKLWGGKLWTSGYDVNTVGQYTNEEVIKNIYKIKDKQKLNIRKFIQVN